MEEKNPEPLVIQVLDTPFSPHDLSLHYLFPEHDAWPDLGATDSIPSITQQQAHVKIKTIYQLIPRAYHLSYHSPQHNTPHQLSFALASRPQLNQLEIALHECLDLFQEHTTLHLTCDGYATTLQGTSNHIPIDTTEIDLHTQGLMLRASKSLDELSNYTHSTKQATQVLCQQMTLKARFEFGLCSTRSERQRMHLVEAFCRATQEALRQHQGEPHHLMRLARLYAESHFGPVDRVPEALNELEDTCHITRHRTMRVFGTAIALLLGTALAGMLLSAILLGTPFPWLAWVSAGLSLIITPAPSAGMVLGTVGGGLLIGALVAGITWFASGRSVESQFYGLYRITRRRSQRIEAQQDPDANSRASM